MLLLLLPPLPLLLLLPFQRCTGRLSFHIKFQQSYPFTLKPTFTA